MVAYQHTEAVWEITYLLSLRLNTVYWSWPNYTFWCFSLACQATDVEQSQKKKYFRAQLLHWIPSHKSALYSSYFIFKPLIAPFTQVHPRDIMLGPYASPTLMFFLFLLLMFFLYLPIALNFLSGCHTPCSSHKWQCLGCCECGWPTSMTHILHLSHMLPCDIRLAKRRDVFKWFGSDSSPTMDVAHLTHVHTILPEGSPSSWQLSEWLST